MWLRQFVLPHNFFFKSSNIELSIQSTQGSDYEKDRSLSYGSVLVFQSSSSKVPQTDWRKTGIYCLRVVKPEVRNQGVGRTMLLLEALGTDPFQVSRLASGSSLACGSITPIRTWGTHCVCLSVCPNFPFLQDTKDFISMTSS